MMNCRLPNNEPDYYQLAVTLNNILSKGRANEDKSRPFLRKCGAKIVIFPDIYDFLRFNPSIFNNSALIMC